MRDEAAVAPQVHVVQLGAGPQPALLLHCSLAHSGAWKGLMAALGHRWRATAFDHPGHGRSPDWDGVEDLNDLSTRIARELLPEGPVDLVGHSFGGSVALRIALEQPERVRRLVLIEPVLFSVARADAPEVYAWHRAHMGRVRAEIARGAREEAARFFLDSWGTGLPWEAMPEAQRRYMVERIHLIPAGMPTLEDDRQGFLRPGRLEALALPVLLLEGTASPPVIAAINAGLARRIPGARRAAVAGAGHMLPITHPAEVAARIEPFLD